ncbi:MAG: NAD(P)-dependent oxidoreductase [Silicimonas sp.]|nr:NAD(P)-dependent oxidoreductase [Silicimonas sp.]NNL35779.1 NAD(P)-dependent oxidoreductase [Silicimonas sp.]
MTKPTIGFIGVGYMGHGMAKNIVEAGYPLVTMAHRKRDAVDDLIGRGATEAKSPREIAEQADIVHLCVTGSPQVEANIRGENGLLAGLRKDAIIIDCSTSDPVSTLTLAEEVKTAGGHFADAPLSRTPKEAWEGTLDAMVGADDAVFARIKPVIECWAGVIVHLGETGLGHKMKLINNFIGMGYGALYAEALAIARLSGITPEQFDSVIRPGRLSNGFYETFMKWTLERDENAHKFAISNGHKDMAYLTNLCTAVGAVNPVQAVVKNSYAAMDAAGEGDRFVPMLADFIARANGIKDDR